MDIELINNERKAEWDCFIQEHPYAIAWQSYEWQDVLKNHYRFEFYPIAAVDSGRIVGVLPLYRIRTFPGKDVLISVPYAVAGGIVSTNDEISRMLIGKAIEISRKFNSCGIVLKQYKLGLQGEFHTDASYYNSELDIARPLDVIRADFSASNNQRIDEASKHPFVLDYPANDLDTYYSILLRCLHQRGIPCVSKEWIRDLLKFNMYSIALLRNHGNVVAGTLVKEFKKTVSFPFTCSDRRKGKDGPEYYRLYWELIQLFSAKGFEVCHSGRIPNSDQTDAYRLGWGGIKFPYYYHYYPNQDSQTEYASRRGKKRGILESIWKKLPPKAAGALGPIIVRRFP